MSERSAVFFVSVGAHALLASGLVALREPPPRRETIAIAVVEAPPPPPPAAAPEPPPPPAAPGPEAPPAPAPARAKAAPPKAAPKAAEPPAAPAADPLPDFGLALSGGVGAGLAVPAGDPRGAGASGKPPGAAKAPAAKAPRPGDGGCDEPAGKPKAIAVPQPAYAEKARAAGVEGKVRVEIGVDERGRVTGARVLQGLGHGLDEAALDAARRASFEPASRCGKPVAATFVIGMRFSL